MNRKDLEWLDARLQEYGEWVAAPTPGLGYPQCSPEQRIRENGVRVQSGVELISPEYEPGGRIKEIREIHNIVRDLPSRQWRLYIHGRYVHRLRGQRLYDFTGENKKTLGIVDIQVLNYIYGAINHRG